MNPEFTHEIDFEHWERRALLAIARVEELSESQQSRYWSVVDGLVATWFPDTNPVGEIVDEGLIHPAQFMMLVLIQEQALESITADGEPEVGCHD